MIYLHEQRYEYMEEINEGILRQIPVNKASPKPVALDIGCGSGALSEAVRKKGYTVWGIETNTDAAQKAAGRIDRVIKADCTDFESIKKELAGSSFDIIIFSDVLEHLYDPFYVLKEYSRFLRQGGRLLISVPNMAVWTVRLNLLFGRFKYANTGIMDRTHIRFFTFKSARQLVNAAGYAITKTDYTPFLIRSMLPVIKNIYKKHENNSDNTNRPGRRSIIDSPLYKKYMRYVYPLEYCFLYPLKTLFAFRIIIAGVKL